MKTTLIFLAVLAACVALFVFAPHHRRKGEIFKACTLGEVYGELFSDAMSVPARRMHWFVMFALAGLVAAFYPAAVVLLLRSTASRPALIVGGLIAVLGAAVNLLGIIVSHMSFGFGTSTDKDMTAFAAVIPVSQALVGILSILIGCSATLFAWAGRVVAA